jgi:hypothetical protein
MWGKSQLRLDEEQNQTMMSIIRLTTILFAAVMLAAAQPQSTSDGPQLFTLWGQGNGTASGTGGGLQGVSQTNLVGAAGFALTWVNGQLLGNDGNGKGTCSLEDGTIELTTSKGTISMSQVGMACNVTSGQGPNTFTATYLVTQGTGVYQGLTGTGSVVVGFSGVGSNTGLIRMDGVLLSPASSSTRN